MDSQAIIRVLDFFVPVDVLSAVLLVFAMENVLESYVTTYVDQTSGLFWLGVYICGLLLVALLNYVSADDHERAELGADVDDVFDED